MEEQVLQDTAIQTESTEAVETVENKSTEETPKTYSQEEYDKAVKSAAGKAKNEILKELGVSSVKDFNILKRSYEDAIKNAEDLASQNENLNNRLVLKDLNIREDVEDDFISLAKKRITTEKTFTEAAKEVAELYPNMIKEINSKTVKTGSEKKDGSKKESTYSEEMLKRYPHLANHKKI